jgi:hypothetical protein
MNADRNAELFIKIGDQRGEILKIPDGCAVY